MIRQPHIILLLLLTIIWDCSFAQNTSEDKQVKVANQFVDAYNRQNYSQMKKVFFLLGRILPIKKALRQAFEPNFIKFGAAKLGSIQFQTKNKITVELIYEKDVNEKDFLNIHFNKRNKVSGLFFKSPDFLYPKINETFTNNITAKNKALKIDSLLNRKFANGFSGNVIAVDNESLVYKKCFGYSNYANKELLNDSSIFELASCSKQFTGMAIMMLVEQGKINYSDNIQKYIPDLPYQNITIENLLTHTSGLPDYMELLQKHWNKTKFATNYDIVSLFKKYKPKPNFAPNETFDYSNTGYALLSIIIEKVSSTTYAEFLDKNIFKPSDMQNTRVYNTRRTKNEKINNYAYGYVSSGKSKNLFLPDSLPDYKYVIYLDGITGDGTVNTTIIDLVKWDKALRENKLVQKSTLERAFSKYKLKNGKETEYGYGQSISISDKKERVVYHGGSWPGYFTFVLHFVDKPIMIAILSNNENTDVTKLADQIALILLDTK